MIWIVSIPLEFCCVVLIWCWFGFISFNVWICVLCLNLNLFGLIWLSWLWLELTVSSCATRRHAFLLNKKTCLLGAREDMSSCATSRSVLCNRKTCLLKRYVHLLHRKTRLLVAQEDMSSCAPRVVLCNKKTCAQEDKCSCATRRHVFLCNKKTCLLIQQEDMTSVQQEDVEKEDMSSFWPTRTQWNKPIQQEAVWRIHLQERHV